jgi:phytoene dehydrogenase-like protein
MKMHVVVVGGGLAALVAANRLADRGAVVTLLEAKRRLGGRATSEQREGFILDQGPRALYDGGATARALRAFEISAPGRAQRLGHALALTNGAVHLLPFRPSAASRTKLLTPAAKLELGRFRQELLQADPASVAGLDVQSWLEEKLEDPVGRDVMAAGLRVICYSGDLNLLSAEVAVTQVQLERGQGSRYLDGVWQRLVEHLARRALERRVEVRTRTRVEALVRAGSGWRVVANGSPLLADSVVVAPGTPESARRLLPAEIGTRHWQLGPPAVVATLDLGLARLPRPSRRFALGIDEPTYCSVFDPPADLARDGVLIRLAGYVRTSESADGWRERLEAVADRVQPGWRRELRYVRYLPNMVAQTAQPIASRGGLGGRPPVALPETAGLFLAGDWVGPQGILSDAATASGWEAADKAVACSSARTMVELQAST